MIYFIVIILLLSGFTLLALIIRFIQPELIYTIRQTIVKVKTNKAFLDYDANRFNTANTFPDLLMKDFRYETRDYDEKYVLQRVMKIRELYRILDLRRPAVPGLTRERKPQVCIIELASLLGNLARHITPDLKFSYSTVGAQDLLAFIGNQIITKHPGQSPLKNEKEVEEWFAEHPVSIEQVIEILNTAVFGLAYRQRTQQLVDEDEQVQREARSHTPNVNQTAPGASNTPLQVKSVTSPEDAPPPQINIGAKTAPSSKTLPRPIRVFVSYSHQDERYLKDNSLLGALKGLEKEGVEFWFDRNITAGNKWDDEIKNRISSSEIVLVLVSQAFLDSPYCQTDEIPLFLQKAEQRGLIIFPLMLSRCEWQRHEWLRIRQFLPANDKNIEEDFTARGKRKRLFHEIRQQLRTQIEVIRSSHQ